MKKFLAVVLSAFMLVSFAACGNKTENVNNETTTATATIDSETAKYISYTKNGGSVTFTFNSLPKSLTRDAWLGICEIGEYKTSNEANYKSIAYAYQNNDGNFTLDLSGIAKGQTYSLVLCDSDYQGETVLQFDVKIKDDDYNLYLSVCYVYRGSQDSSQTPNENSNSNILGFSEPTGCTITSRSQTSNFTIIYVKWNSKSDAINYAETIKKAGQEAVVESNKSGSYKFQSEKVTILYTDGDEEVSNYVMFSY